MADEKRARFSRRLTGCTLSQAQGLTSSRSRRGHNSHSTNEEGKPSGLEDHCSLHFRSECWISFFTESVV